MANPETTDPLARLEAVKAAREAALPLWNRTRIRWHRVMLWFIRRKLRRPQ